MQPSLIHYYSPPFSICTNISLENQTTGECTDFTQTKLCHVNLHENLTTQGNYTLVIKVKNDVSLKSAAVRIQVKNTGKDNDY